MIIEGLRCVRQSLRNEGLRATLAICGSRVVDVGFDLRYGTDTYGWVSPGHFGLDAERVANSEYYKPSHGGPLRQVLASLDLPGRRVLFDIGCGKGRVLMIAAELGFDIARGIEFSPRLAVIAQKNLERFARRRQTATRCEVILDDIRAHTLRDDENVFYLFNPFDGLVMSSVVQKIQESLVRKPRQVHVVYRAPEQRRYLDGSSCFESPIRFCSLGQEYLLYRSTLGPSAASSS
jgi:SAM-dependent methyltransferase